MESVAILINPDLTLNALIMDYLKTFEGLVCVEFPSEGPAAEWMKKDKRPVEVIFLGHNMPSFLALLPQLQTTKEAHVFMIQDQKEEEWTKCVFAINDLVDNILIKPFRPLALVERVNRLVKVPLSTAPSVLLLDDSGDGRDTMREYLAHCGFGKVYEVSDADSAVDLLKDKGHEVALALSHWDMPSMEGLIALRKIRAVPRLFSLPFVMVTSQSSLEQVKAIQSRAAQINGYLPRPVTPAQIQSLLDRVARYRKMDRYLREARLFAKRGVLQHSVELLGHAIKALPGSAPLLEELGDAYLAQPMINPEEETERRIKAVEAYEEAIRQEPLRTSLVIKCFDILVLMDRTEDAIRLLKNHLFRFGFDDELRTRLARLYLKRGDYGAAGVELRRAISVNPSNAEAQSLIQITEALDDLAQRGRQAA